MAIDPLALARAIVDFLEEKKGEDILLLDLVEDGLFPGMRIQRLLDIDITDRGVCRLGPYRRYDHACRDPQRYQARDYRKCHERIIPCVFHVRINLR